MEIIGYLPRVARGERDPYGFSDALYAAIANSLLESGYNAAIVKSLGGTDDVGESWSRLKANTIAHKSKKNGNRRAWREGLGLPNANRLRPTLTAGQDKLWRKVFKRAKYKQLEMSVAAGIAQLRARRRGILVLNEEQAKKDADADVSAAKLAWNILKKAGAQTLLMMAEKAVVPILDDTGALLESMAPGDPMPANQYREVGPGDIRIGSTLPQAQAFRARPFWPRNMGPWMTRAIEAGREAIRERLIEVLQS
jgi:hypothetical protein